MNRYHRIGNILVILAAILIPALPANAQGKLTYGQVITGRITNDTFRAIYSFQGTKGDVVDITLSRTDGTLDPMLILMDDQSNIIARDDDSGPGGDAALLSQELSRDGEYFLIVTRFGQERGLTTGGYSLTLVRVGLQGGTGATLHYGDSVVGELNNEQFEQVYVFYANRGDIVNATLQRISGNLDALLILANAQGKVLVVNDEDPDSPGTLDAAITDMRIEQSGNYLLVATRFGREAGDSRGGYSLSLNRLLPESLGKVPEKAILLDYGNSARGSIDASGVMRFYLIEAHKGDVLTINAERTRGNLDPTLTLYTSDLKELTTHDMGQRGQSARISAFTAPMDGSYILMVSRFNRDKGITAGDYLLTLVGRTAVTVGAGGKATMQYNTVANAIINDSNVAQQYSFAGSAGDVVTIAMDTTSGNLLAQVILLDPAGKQMAQDDPGSGSARLSKVKLPASGNYIIVATRRGREKGSTQGAYRLTLSREAR
jgi:hypothetical protein